MTSILFKFIGVLVFFTIVSSSHASTHNGSTKTFVPRPTLGQLRYQSNEIMSLIHFNMATFVGDGDPACNSKNWNIGDHPSSSPTTFNPTKLDTSNWVQTMLDLGSKHAVLTAKHGCGFLLWPTEVKLPDGSDYSYSVGRNASAIKVDVLQQFVDAARAKNIGVGFYYSLPRNYYLNVDNFQVQPSPLPNQARVTQDEFEAIAMGHLTELWTNYGRLTEIWFDGGYSSSLKSNVTALVSSLQPDAAAFNGLGLARSPVRWIGTESGAAPNETWSTGEVNGGDSNSLAFNPAGCDTTLQDGDTWFYSPGQSIRSLQQMTQVYDESVGRNCVLELDLAVDRDGLVDPMHAQRYKELGDWIRACHGDSNRLGSLDSLMVHDNSTNTFQLNKSFNVSRVVLREDLQYGQRIRKYTVEYEDSSTGQWMSYSNGLSIGNKRIDKKLVDATAIRVTVVEAAEWPVSLLGVAAYADKLCNF